MARELWLIHGNCVGRLKEGSGEGLGAVAEFSTIWCRDATSQLHGTLELELRNLSSNVAGDHHKYDMRRCLWIDPIGSMTC